MRHTSIKPVGSAIDELVTSLGIRKKLQEYNAVIYWETVVGAQIAKMTTATRIIQGVLFVQVKNSTWRNELNLRKREIVDKLNSALGIDVVRDIKFK